MKKITIADVKQQVVDRDNRRKSLMAEKASAEQDAKKYAAAALAAAKAGDVAEYRRNKNAEVEASDRAVVLGVQLESDAGIDRTMVLSAWDNYKEEYNKRFAALCRELETNRLEFDKLFSEIVEAQNEALKNREQLALILGMKMPERYIAGEDGFPGISMPDVFPINVASGISFRGINYSPDAVAYLSRHDTFPTPNPILEKLHAVLKFHRAY